MSVAMCTGLMQAFDSHIVVSVSLILRKLISSHETPFGLIGRDLSTEVLSRCIGTLASLAVNLNFCGDRTTSAMTSTPMISAIKNKMKDVVGGHRLLALNSCAGKITLLVQGPSPLDSVKTPVLKLSAAAKITLRSEHSFSESPLNSRFATG